MTFSRIEILIVAVGLKLSVAIGFVALLGLVASLFLGRTTGAALTGVCGCGLAMALVAGLYLAACQAVVAKLRKGEGA
jgi:hypothetical protein